MKKFMSILLAILVIFATSSLTVVLIRRSQSDSPCDEPQHYMITYDLGVNNYATLENYTTDVIYGEPFKLEVPYYPGSAEFYGWYLADENGDATDEKITDGIYLYHRNILVIGKWQEWSPIVPGPNETPEDVFGDDIWLKD